MSDQQALDIGLACVLEGLVEREVTPGVRVVLIGRREGGLAHQQVGSAGRAHQPRVRTRVAGVDDPRPVRSGQ
jgi:hypothetical protein